MAMHSKFDYSKKTRITPGKFYDKFEQSKKFNKGDIVESTSGPTADKRGKIIEIRPSKYEVIFEGLKEWTLKTDSELKKVDYACEEHKQEDFVYSKENGLVCPFCHGD